MRTVDQSAKRKLIEVSIPLEAVNEQSGREKSIRHGHPSTLHLWWSRKPTATARAVLFAQLVDDPSSFEVDYRNQARENGLSEEEVEVWVAAKVDAERARLHRLMTAMSDWDNLNDTQLWKQVRQEIQRSTGGNPPPIVDPFAGGGSIPLEAQRLGLKAHASDLNPVAVLINRAMIDVPPRFANRAPIHPQVESRSSWGGAEGLAEDVRRYGEWMRDQARERIGGLYPAARLSDGSSAPVIAWKWARTVTCPNPACGIRMPLVSSWWLGKKKGKEAYVVPTVTDGRVEFTIGHDPAHAPTKDDDGTVGRRGAECIGCGTHVDLKYIRAEGKAGRIGQQLMAVVAQGQRSRIYLEPNDQHAQAAEVDRPKSVPGGELPTNPRDFKTPNYGMTQFADLFTNRQLTALTTFSDLVGEARERALQGALASGMERGTPLSDGGNQAEAYADAVATYLAFVVSRCTDYSSSLSSWNSPGEKMRNVFGRQAVPMVWDFSEVYLFSESSGGYANNLKWVYRVIENFPQESVTPGHSRQLDAASLDYQGKLISTDPPYYDNIGYSDLSDFFYVWLRRSLRRVHPDLFGTMLVPKAEELVANPYRHGGKDGAQEFFEDGFNNVFARARESALPDYPITVFYAFKQSETTTGGTASTGWETLLEGMVRNRWQVTGTWPMRSERTGRMLSVGTNALASSIVLALRPRPDSAGVVDQRTFREELLEELPDRLHEMQKGTIAPVDLPQAAIGPGIAIYSRYDRVLNADGASLTVREALQMINAVLDEVLDEQENDFQAETRWCIKWYAQNGFARSTYGTAETLASALNTSVSHLARSGAVESRAGQVKLLAHDELSTDYRPDRDNIVTLWEVTLQAATAIGRPGEGIGEAGKIVALASDRVDRQSVKDLAFLMFAQAEKRRESSVAQLFNALATSWPEVTQAADDHIRSSANQQTTIDLS
ncbi:DUF1156 domain-containing protein [Kocuria sp. ZOR0020]|uniref:DUF1156 domain-containing protein n=1 Tax=Kocuria sp. ZOR0020 TaxID=1339234 RepID=UPI0006466FEE|nr:DUF1156 domain-containing protein [Kocuria sp. ZOR0020]